MITDLKRLSRSLDKAAPAPGANLLAAIKADRARIDREINEIGSSEIRVDGRTFRLVRANAKDKAYSREELRC